jgi:hypothetical protein
MLRISKDATKNSHRITKRNRKNNSTVGNTNTVLQYSSRESRSPLHVSSLPTRYVYVYRRVLLPIRNSLLKKNTFLGEFSR